MQPISLLIVLTALGQRASDRPSGVTPTGANPPAAAVDRTAIAHYRTGLGLVERGMHDLAVPELEAFLAAAPDSGDATNARYALAVAYSRLGRDADAVRELNAVLRTKDFTFASDALLLAAECELRRNEPTKAVALLDALARDHADRAKEEPAAVLRCEALVAAAQDAEALDALRQTIAQFPATPALERLRFLLGRTEATLKHDQAAVEVLAALRATHGSGPYAPSAALIEARCRLTLGDASGARAALSSVKTPPPDLGDAFAYWVAASERRLGNDRAAAERLATAITAFPTSALVPDMLFEQGAALVQLGDNAGAIAAYAALIERAPTHAGAMQAAVGRGTALAQIGKPDEARTALDAVLAQHADLPKDLRIAAEDELVELAAAAAQWEAVERHARSLLALGATPAREPELWLRLGVAQAKLGNADAQASLERAIATAVDSSGTRDAASAAVRDAARAQLLALSRREGRSDDTRRLLTELAPSSPDALFELASAEATSGDSATAEKSFDQFIRTHPNDQRVAEARARRVLALAALKQYEELDVAARAAASSLDTLDPALRSSVRFEHAIALSALGKHSASTDVLNAIVSDASAASWHAHALLELARRAFGENRDTDAVRLAGQAERSLTTAPSGDRPGLQERIEYLNGAARFRALSRGTTNSTTRPDADVTSNLDANAEAASALASFIKKFPASTLAPSARLMCGQAFLAANRAADAIAPLDALVASNPPPDLAEPALLALSQAHASLGAWKASEDAALRHIASFPDAPRASQAQFAIAWSREQRGEHASAIEAYTPIAHSGDGETSARSQFQIGECLFALKRYNDAVREFLKVDMLFAQPTWRSAALLEAGRCFVALGRDDDARRQFDELLERFPDSTFATSARRERERLAAAPATSSSLP